MCDIYMNLYHYSNMPDTIDTRYFIKTMMYHPGIAVFQDEYTGICALPFNVFGTPDIYGNPRQIQVYSENGYTKAFRDNYRRVLKPKEFVIIWSNFMRYVPFTTIDLFAWRIASITRTSDVNVENQKTPKMVRMTDSSRLTVLNVLKEVDGNVPVVEVNDSLNTENFVPIDLTVPYVADKLAIQKNVIWNEFLTWCGVENMNTDKKERLVANEVMGNYGNVEMGRNTGLAARQEGLEQMNRLFGTNVSVKFNSEIPTLLNMPELLDVSDTVSAIRYQGSKGKEEEPDG